MTDTTFVRPPAVAGMFYPSSAEHLRREVGEMLGGVIPSKRKGDLIALVSPHAGYVYSGVTAAHGYALLKDRSYDAVILVGPSHREYFDGVSTFPGTAYSTPLGTVPVNEPLRDALVRGSDLVELSMDGHRGEHSLEVQLPFLQEALGEFTIVPIVMGDQRREYCEMLGKEIAGAVGTQHVLLVASSDLSHYYTSENARKLDALAIGCIERLDGDGLLRGLELQQTEACGGGPIAAVILAAKALGAAHCDILHACNSGDVSGDADAVVGYVSAALWNVH